MFADPLLTPLSIRIAPAPSLADPQQTPTSYLHDKSSYLATRANCGIFPNHQSGSNSVVTGVWPFPTPSLHVDVKKLKKVKFSRNVKIYENVKMCENPKMGENVKMHKNVKRQIKK